MSEGGKERDAAITRTHAHTHKVILVDSLVESYITHTRCAIS